MAKKVQDTGVVFEQVDAAEQNVIDLAKQCRRLETMNTRLLKAAERMGKRLDERMGECDEATDQVARLEHILSEVRQEYDYVNKQSSELDRKFTDATIAMREAHDKIEALSYDNERYKAALVEVGVLAAHRNVG